MASKFYEAGNAKTIGETLRSVEDQPLSFEENYTLDLMRRKIAAGFYDDAGRYNRAPSNAAEAASVPQASTAASPAVGAATSGGFNAPPLTLGRVQPGDLITAGFANALIDACLTLDGRLRVLESRGSVVVSPVAPVVPVTPAVPVAPEPPKGRFNVLAATAAATTGQKSVTVTVTGTGLDPDKLRSIQIGEVTIDLRKVKGTDTIIKFLVPSTDAARIGRAKTVVVTNDTGEEDSAQIKTSGTNSLLDNLR